VVYTYADIAKMIDHALLVPTMTTAELEAGIDLAIAYEVASVCVMPYYLKKCSSRLADTSVKASTTIGFPHGVSEASVKLAEAKQSIADGCEELDVVVNISRVLSDDWGYVRDELGSIIQVSHAAQRKVKVIFENCYLEESHKKSLCELCNELNADWVKTSTGFGSSGATMDDLKLMCQHAAEHVQVKAAGGVRDLDSVLAIRSLGVTRIGTSRTQGLLNECRTRLGLSEIAADSASDDGEY